MIRLPGSITSRSASRRAAEAPRSLIRLRLTSRVPPSSGRNAKIHTHCSFSERNTSVRSRSQISTRMPGPSAPSGSTSPTARCWNSGRIRSALRMPSPSRFSIQS
jgi:hypothetical protein